MATAGENGETSLQDKLQEQVASSVREALDKSTSILSNLHRLSSYLDVMSSMLSAPDRLKSALDQIQAVRSDCASLLQTIYLGEIGIQSLQDIGKATSMAAGMLPMLSDNLSITTVTPSAPPPPDTPIFDEGSDFILDKRHEEDLIDGEPPPKKS